MFLFPICLAAQVSFSWFLIHTHYGCINLMLINKVDLLLCVSPCWIQNPNLPRKICIPRRVSSELGPSVSCRSQEKVSFYSPMQHQCFPADMHLVLVTKQGLSVSVIESLDALLRQDLEDQGGLEDLVDHLHHLCLVDLVDPRVKKRIIKWTLEVAKEISEVINSLTTRDLQHTLQQFYICSFNKWLTLENKYSLNLHCLATPHIRYLL